MKITANGKDFELAERTSLPDFLQSIGHQVGLVVVERNEEALPPSQAQQTILQEGDRLEIVKIVAGG